jgi:hypothetical protein
MHSYPKILHVVLALSSFLNQVIVAYSPLSDDTLRSIPSPDADFDIHNGAMLAPILIPRVPGTPGSAAVQQHFVDFFRTNLPKWTIEFQNSTSKTPVSGDKEVPFVNIIITRDPPWARLGEVGRLNLVAHYDSKLYPEGFIGAIDSAAPCAMIMHAAHSVDEALTRKWAAMEAEGADSGLEEAQGIQILFLDGEEAFLAWNEHDSLYGARFVLYQCHCASTNRFRSLAETWEQTAHPALSTYRTTLSSINLFVLLDLLGSKNPAIRSYFKTTHWAYKHMATLESRLRGLSSLRSKPSSPFFPDINKAPHEFHIGGIEDDHIPFMKRGVEVLHLIPLPFPFTWHTMNDDGEHLDMDTTNDWAKIVTAFVGEWMDLEGYFPTPSGKAQEKRAKLTSKTEL